MLSIIPYIEETILCEECAIIPNIGGFVVHVHDSCFDTEKKMLIPSRREITFNASLKSGDNSLLKAYVRMKKVDINQAKVLLERDAVALYAELNEKKTVSLGLIGELTLCDDGRLVFTLGDPLFINASNYGLLPLVLEPIASSTKGITKSVDFYPSKNKNRNIYIPINRQFFRITTAAVVGIILFFLFATPILEENHFAYEASFIPEYNTKASTSEKATVLASEVKKEETVVPVKVASPIAKVKPFVAAPNVSTKYFHVVVASLLTKAKANRILADIKQKGFSDVGLIKAGSYYRIYAKRFDNRTLAETYLTRLRTQKSYENAWLYISRY
ncbi:MAG: SPOR domain-containing protein [Massilibacteroides sp.]|nr:SPOR domain-containing protein [Massilibacteroides sp.]